MNHPETKGFSGIAPRTEPELSTRDSHSTSAPGQGAFDVLTHWTELTSPNVRSNLVTDSCLEFWDVITDSCLEFWDVMVTLKGRRFSIHHSGHVCV